jgi:N12 class adenine-specific DNA methylase
LENDTLGSIIYTKVMDDCENRLQRVLDNIEHSSLENDDDIVVENKFRKAVIESVSEIVQARTNIECEDSLGDGLALYALNDFDTYNLKAYVHSAINEIAKDTLIAIEKSIKRQEQLERSEKNGLHKTREHNESEHDNSRGLQATNESGQIWEDGTRILGGEKQSTSDIAGDTGNIVGSISQGGRTSEREDEHVDGPVVEEHSPSEPTGHTGISSAQDDDTSSSGRDSVARDSVSTEIKSDKAPNQEAVEDTASFSLSKNEDVTYTEELAKKYEKDDIETVLLSGSGFAEGKQRIVDFFSETHTSAEKVSFLKNEYGIGGGTTFFSDDRTGYSDHDAKGIKLNNFGFDAPSIKLTWSKVAKGIETLIENDKYFEQRNQHDTPPIRRNIETTLLSYADNDISLKEYGYQYEQMQKVPSDKALEAFDNGETLYLLFEDNTESMVEDRTSLSDHINDGGLVGREVEIVSEIANDNTFVDEEKTSINDLVSDADLEYVKEHLLDGKSEDIIESNNIDEAKDDSIKTNIDKLPISQQAYLRLKSLAPHILDGRYNYQKMSTSGFMDLNIDKISENMIAIAHNYIQNGDVMADPDMQIMIDEKHQMALPFSFQNDGIGVYQSVYDEHGTRNQELELDLAQFLSTWLSNIEAQGHVTSKAQYNYEISGTPSFDSQGREIGFDVPFGKNDYSFDENFEIPNGQKTRYNLNVDVIKTLKAIETDNRLATDPEQEILAHYVGWGGIPNAFDSSKTDWNTEYTELKSLLTQDEYELARASTLNAHYTSLVVMDSMYKALSNFGFDGGQILEPAMGTGNFFSAMPKDIREGSTLTGVELDSITGRIAKQLHQSADIQIKGFEETNFKDNNFDVVIGNIPFGSYKVEDKLIHDYFVSASIDKVKDGGIVAVISSKGTLDKKDSSFREEIARKAELIGAIRLPNNAFKQNAGTSVTTDIMFLQKRQLELDELPSWVQLSGTKDGVPVNAYFVENTNMILGEMQFSYNMYGRQSDTTCEPFDDADLGMQLDEAVSNLSAIIDTEIDDMQPQEDNRILDARDYPHIKNFSFESINDCIYYRENNDLTIQDLSETHTKRMLDMIQLRSAVRKIIEVQVDDLGTEPYETARENLNTAYDDFVKAHGSMDSRGVSNVCREDADYPLLCSLEVVDDDEQIQKADIFFRPTIKPHVEIESVSTCVEALGVSKNLKGIVDIEYMSGLVNQDMDTVVSELEGIIFRNPIIYDKEKPYSGFETAETYLSGDVRAKLHVATAFSKEDRNFIHNVNALNEVQPKDLTADQIEVRLGTTWIPSKYYAGFLAEIFEVGRGDVDVAYNDELDQYIVDLSYESKYSFKSQSVYGTDRMYGYEIFLQSMNLKKPKIFDYDSDNKAHFNAKATFAVRDKQEIMMKEFEDWIFAEPQRRNDLVKIYNEGFNNIRVSTYDGSYLTMPNMNPKYKLDPHQKNAIARTIFNNNVLYAHEVGGGKTFAMIGSAMELKRLGLVNKPMITVPNHLVKQTGKEFMKLYPSANILLATKKDFQKENRQRLISKIVTGDYDSIIIAHSTFGRIGVSPERMAKLIKKQVQDFDNAINDSDNNSTVKMLETQRKRLNEQLKKLTTMDRDNQVYFEQLGVDSLFVDEAHEFKNLHVATKMSRVAGVPTSASKKASDLFAKIGIINENDGRVVFATGTPITNSLGEMYTIQRYLQNDDLYKRGLGSFDRWVSTFGEVQTTLEIGIDNSSVRAKERLAKFKNLPEMMNMYRLVADIQTQEMLNLPRPKLRTDKPIVIVAPPSEELLEKNDEFTERVDDIKGGSVDPKVDNALKITNEGRAMALDIRMIDPTLPDYDNSKVNMMVRNVFDIWEDTASSKSTQMIFSDLGTPNGKSFNIYQDIKDKLVGMGIPEDEVVFIHDAKTDKQKDDLFGKVRSGNVRVLLGSTMKMGTGTNCQDKLIAMHELDCPWRPADVAQREGRILRQGNENEEVSIFRYVTESSFDGYNWNLIESKYNFFRQIQNGQELTSRIAENIDDVGLSYAEIKAIASGNPLLKDKALIDVEVSKLSTLKQQYNANVYRLQDQIAVNIPNRIENLEEKIELWQSDSINLTDTNSSEFAITLKGKEYTDKQDATIMLKGYIESLPSSGKSIDIGNYRGFGLSATRDSIFKKNTLLIKGNTNYTVELGNSASGNLTRIDNEIESIKAKISRSYESIQRYKDDLESAKVEIQKPFTHESDLDKLLAKQRSIDIQLGFNDKDQEFVEDMDEEEISNDIER